MAGPQSNVEANDPEGSPVYNVEQGSALGSGPLNPLPIPATSGEVVGSAAGEYVGYDLRETSGSAAAKVILYDNASAASGNILDEIELASGAAAATPEPQRPGVKVVNGIYASITGAVQGSVFQ